MFLGVVKAISDAIRNNDKAWFKKFIEIRSKLEAVLINRKSLINQGLANVNSNQRIARIAGLFVFLVEKLQNADKESDSEILNELGLKGNAGDLKLIDAPTGFSDHVKSATFLQAAISSAPKCSICGGYLHTIKSVSYDHITPVAAGGSGQLENAQITHPFCNSGIKGAKLG